MLAATNSSTANPIHLVRQGAKRRSTPSVLTPVEIKLLLSGLRVRERALVLVAASTGLRQSELFGLKWGDIDFAQNTMSVTRSIVCGWWDLARLNQSRKPVPVHPTVLETLGEWQQICPYNKPDDWVFASHTASGPEADLGSGDLAQIYSSRRVAGRNSEAIRMAHIPSHVLDSPAECRDRIQSDARAAATFLFAFNVGCLHPGRSQQRNMLHKQPCSIPYLRRKRTALLQSKYGMAKS